MTQPTALRMAVTCGLAVALTAVLLAATGPTFLPDPGQVTCGAWLEAGRVEQRNPGVHLRIKNTVVAWVQGFFDGAYHLGMHMPNSWIAPEGRRPLVDGLRTRLSQRDAAILARGLDELCAASDTDLPIRAVALRLLRQAYALGE